MSGEQLHPWPDGYEGAVSLTFDDGMRSQLEVALPILAENGLRATFYVNSRGPDWRGLLAPWKAVAEAGHEVGNHTVSHPCSCAFKESRADCLETMTLDDMEWEIGEGKRRISEAIPEQVDFTFCYPCYHAHVGEGPDRRSYVPVVARHHVAGRGKGDYANHPLTADLHHLYSFPVERRATSEMIGLVEVAAGQNRWAVLTFHGISEGHLSVTESDFTGLCNFLREHRDRIWTAPVVTVARSIHAWRSAGRNRSDDTAAGTRTNHGP
ncbi:MAG: polysaccharide deacetylase family protein [Gemmatimonadetes bacterium]|nr:polysaccharide deacetylase family protein [Gemmatimonadota bacterium]